MVVKDEQLIAQQKINEELTERCNALLDLNKTLQV